MPGKIKRGYLPLATTEEIQSSLKLLLRPGARGSSIVRNSPGLGRVLLADIENDDFETMSLIEQGFGAELVLRQILEGLGPYLCPQLMIVFGLSPGTQGMPLMLRYENAGAAVTKLSGTGITGASYRTHRLSEEISELADEIFRFAYLE